MLTHNKLSVLEIGCRLATALSKLKSRFLKAEMLGIERKIQLAKMVSHITNIIQEDFEDIELDTTFDYIILSDILKKKHDSAKLLYHAKQYLKPEGCLLISIKNMQCVKKWLLLG